MIQMGGKYAEGDGGMPAHFLGKTPHLLLKNESRRAWADEASGEGTAR